MASRDASRCVRLCVKRKETILATAWHEYLLSLPLTKDDIKRETLNILCKFQETQKPSSPDGTHYMVQVSPFFPSLVPASQRPSVKPPLRPWESVV